MNLTPLDVTQKQFRRILRGLDPAEVEAFQALVASELEALVRENLALGGGAPKASEEIREAARKEAEITISDAELQAEKIVQGAHARFLRIVDDINELKRQRVQFETNVRTLAESHLKLIEAMRDPAREEAVQYVPSRKRAAEE
jgi:cell division initiation protein